MMKVGQFWILTVCSVIVSMLLINTVLLNRDLDREQRILVDNQETAATATTYETAWKQLAVKIYQGGQQDPEMLDLLKKEGVNINVGTPPPPSTAPSKALITPANAAHPNGT